MNNQQQQIQIPTSLKVGDKIGLISTARKISVDELSQAIEVIKKWGVEPIFSKNIFQEHHQFAGTDDERKADLQDMLDRQDIKAILCVRGGYGTVRIVDGLNFETFKKHPKWLAGFSDITVLHSHIHKLNIASLHSTMPISFNTNTQESIESLKKGFFGESLSINCNAHHLNRKGECQAQVIGGNLSILYSLIGSSSDINTAGKILFLEDLDEYLYHIDRMMMNLKRSGKLNHLKGLIVGGMSKMNDNNIPFGKTAEEIILDAVSEFDYPVCFNFPAGHIGDNRTLKLGQVAQLKIEEKTTLKYDKSA
jgi:muramoyltetrapeptide carboxypeptidase